MSKKRDRAKIGLDAQVAEALAAPPGGKRTATDSDNHRRSRASYDLRPETIEEIRVIADELGVNIYAVAQKLLDFGIAEYQAGRLKLQRRPVITSWELE